LGDRPRLRAVLLDPEHPAGLERLEGRRRRCRLDAVLDPPVGVAERHHQVDRAVRRQLSVLGSLIVTTSTLS
jgi:hypothetical protein